MRGAFSRRPKAIRRPGCARNALENVAPIPLRGAPRSGGIMTVRVAHWAPRVPSNRRVWIERGHPLAQSQSQTDFDHRANAVRATGLRHSVEIPVARLDQAALGAYAVTNVGDSACSVGPPLA